MDARRVIDAVMVALGAAVVLVVVGRQLFGWDAGSLDAAWAFVGSLLVAVLLMRLVAVQALGERAVSRRGRQVFLWLGLVIGGLVFAMALWSWAQ